jgi:hypothetical protein
MRTPIYILSRYYNVGYYIDLFITMLGKYPSLRALVWHFNGYYDSPDISIHFLNPTGIVLTRVSSVLSMGVDMIVF